jgi:hypothetical protein
MIVTKCTVYCRYWRYKPGLKTEPYCKNQKKPCAEAALNCTVPRWITNPIRGEYEPLPPRAIYRAGQQEESVCR